MVARAGNRLYEHRECVGRLTTLSNSDRSDVADAHTIVETMG